MFKTDILRRKGDKGFTLVELLVVISIIGVLATLVLLQLGTARARARDTKRITDVNQIRTGIDQYFEDNGGKYPAAGTWEADIAKYLTRVPTDPLDSSRHYVYKVTTNLRGFQVIAELENKAAALGNDADLKPADDPVSGAFLDASGDPAGTPPGTPKETCVDSDITNTNCQYDQGVKP